MRVVWHFRSAGAAKNEAEHLRAVCTRKFDQLGTYFIQSQAVIGLALFQGVHWHIRCSRLEHANLPIAAVCRSFIRSLTDTSTLSKFCYCRSLSCKRLSSGDHRACLFGPVTSMTEGVAMFASRIAKPPTKAADSPTRKLADRQAIEVGKFSGVWGKEARGGHEQEAELTPDPAAPRGLDWSLSRISIFPPDAPPPAPERSGRPVVILQPKLAIGSVDDPLEHEADRVGEQVMRIPDPEFSIANASPQVSRKRSAGGEGEGRREQAEQAEPASIGGARSPAIQPFSGRASGETAPAPSSVERVLASPGKPLEQGLRARMEAHFAQGFSRVRVHSDPAAGQSAREIGANAYTVRHHIVFGANQFSPETSRGRSLLAHELTHVVQQTTLNGVDFHQCDGTPSLSSLPESGIVVQRDTQHQSTGPASEERPRERFPWIGRIHGTPSAALRRIPGKDPGNPHAGTLADLVEGTFVDVLGLEKGWLHVQATVDGKELQGYISQELVQFNRSDSPPASAGPTVQDILRLDQTIPIKGLVKDQPNYIDHFRGHLESAPLGPDITFFPNTGLASQTGVSISKESFYIDKDPLGGFSIGQNGIYKSRVVAEAVVADLTKESPNTPVFTYYLQDGIIFPTILSDTTIPNMLPFIRQKREQDLADIQATADLAKAVAVWYIGARFPIKISSGGTLAGAGGKEAAKQLEKEAAKQTEKEAAKELEKEAAKQTEKEAAKQTEKEATKQAVKRVPQVQPSAPAGWKGTLNAFGKEIEWPAAGEVKIPAGAADLAKLRAAGVTEQWAVEQAKIYREVLRLNPKNPSALLRAEWLEAIAVRLRGLP
jgi:hypothetical protein